MHINTAPTPVAPAKSDTAATVTAAASAGESAAGFAAPLRGATGAATTEGDGDGEGEGGAGGGAETDTSAAPLGLGGGGVSSGEGEGEGVCDCVEPCDGVVVGDGVALTATGPKLSHVMKRTRLLPSGMGWGEGGW